jgi:putative glutathione S-transferase
MTPRLSAGFIALLAVTLRKTCWEVNLRSPFAAAATFVGTRPHPVHLLGAKPTSSAPKPRLQDKKQEGGDPEPTPTLDKGFNLLELANGIVPQSLVVRTAKASLRLVWQRMMAELAPQDRGGNYVRPKYSYVSASESTRSDDGALSKFPPEGGRYHLYVGNPCPWCHRAVLAVKTLELDSATIGVTRLQDNPLKASRGGWIFSAKDPDPMFRSFDLRELYDRLSPGGTFKGRCTAPLLVCKKTERIVSNESADIVRFINRVSLKRGEAAGRQPLDLYPPALAADIDSINGWVYELLNNGVYRCGFATTQAAYDRASDDVRLGLERCDSILASQPYLAGSQFTEADLRLLPTVLRFDGAYAPLFRAGGGHARIRNYPHLHAWLVRCWELHPGVRESIDLADACSSYFAQLFPLNPGGIVPSPAVNPKDLGLSN